MNLTGVTAILFDFDGVIADTESGRYSAYCDIFEEYGYDLRSRCTIDELAGLTGDGFIGKFFPEIPAEQAVEIIRRRQTHYMNHLDRFCKPCPGMQPTVRDLKALGFYLALTTANSTAAAQRLLEVAGVADCFDAVCGREICEDPVSKVKDYSRVPEHIGRTTDECIVIEDSPVGVAGAKRSGFRCIAFEHFKSPVITELADAVIHQYDELRQIFGI
jgi:HAD superfamily hydrolase (TIGR01509 family)